MRERIPFLVVVLLVSGGLLLGFGLLDSAATGPTFAPTCPSGTSFPAQTCIDLQARLRAEGTLIAIGFLLVAVGVVALILGLSTRVRSMPDIPVHRYGPRNR